MKIKDSSLQPSKKVGLEHEKYQIRENNYKIKNIRGEGVTNK